jgi:hypothetical protein
VNRHLPDVATQLHHVRSRPADVIATPTRLRRGRTDSQVPDLAGRFIAQGG